MSNVLLLSHTPVPPTPSYDALLLIELTSPFKVPILVMRFSPDINAAAFSRSALIPHSPLYTVSDIALTFVPLPSTSMPSSWQRNAIMFPYMSTNHAPNPPSRYPGNHALDAVVIPPGECHLQQCCYILLQRPSLTLQNIPLYTGRIAP